MEQTTMMFDDSLKVVVKSQKKMDSHMAHIPPFKKKNELKIYSNSV